MGDSLLHFIFARKTDAGKLKMDNFLTDH